MDEPVGSLASTPALEVVRGIAIGRQTGVLELWREDTDESESLYFVSGELYLRPEHPLALALGPEPSSVDSATAKASPGEGKDVVNELWLTQAVDRLRAWRAGSYRFAADPSGISTDLVGPLSTFSIVMTGAVSGFDEFSLLRRLGGDAARFAVSPVGQSPVADLVRLDPHEAFFLSRMEQPVTVRELLQQSDLERQVGLQQLCRLLAAGLICPEAELPRRGPGLLLDASLLERFSKRIEQSLERQPLSLEPDEHRQKIASLLGRLGGLTYYELLGIGTGATSEEIHAAYSDLARLVHPCQAESLGLQGKEGGMLLLLEKATEAYLTLNDRERSRQYLREIGSPQGGQGAKVSVEERRQEVETIAEENYRRARVMAAREELHFAVELLQQAVRVHPKAEYYVLLGRCQARNPRWLNKAVASFGRALQLDEDNIGTRLELARVLEASGEAGRARREYREVLQRQPSNSDASGALERLRGHSAAPGETTWLQRLLASLPFGQK
ncbi:MAG: DnaJ domain-containing protein [Acidobacteriota bacterium]|nr:DnaJ domain-containing protein [Acidobacteriota bacterium]